MGEANRFIIVVIIIIILTYGIILLAQGASRLCLVCCSLVCICTVPPYPTEVRWYAPLSDQTESLIKEEEEEEEEMKVISMPFLIHHLQFNFSLLTSPPFFPFCPLLINRFLIPFSLLLCSLPFPFLHPLLLYADY